MLYQDRFINWVFHVSLADPTVYKTLADWQHYPSSCYKNFTLPCLLLYYLVRMDEGKLKRVNRMKCFPRFWFIISFLYHVYNFYDIFLIPFWTHIGHGRHFADVAEAYLQSQNNVNIDLLCFPRSNMFQHCLFLCLNIKNIFFKSTFFLTYFGCINNNVLYIIYIFIF